jgi:carbamoyltransferase
MQDAAAVLLDSSGQVIAAVEEERLTRKKHTGDFPQAAIAWCLQQGGVSASELNAIAFNMRPWQGVAARARSAMKNFPRSLAFFGSRGGNWSKMLRAETHFRRMFPTKAPFHWVEHHRAHALSAHLPSGYARAAVLVVDGSGELASVSAWRAEGSHLEPLWSVPFPNSLGYFYSALTQYLGFRPAVAEGKTMGLSSYGEPDAALRPHFEEMIGLDATISPSWFRYQDGGDMYFSPRWIDTFGLARVPEGPLTERHYAIAATGQERLEQIVFSLLRRLHADTGLDTVCLAGGVALNCVANGQILEHTPFQRIFVQPVAHDAGTSWGAALHAHLAHGGTAPAPMSSVAFGPCFGAAAIDAAITQAGLTSTVVSDPAVAAANRIAAGEVIGWFQGRVELGPRALGQRSILADPRGADTTLRVNEKVKRREAFRPFAPAVLESEAGSWFEGEPTPYMTTVHKVLADRQALVPAITHVDGTARVQTVRADDGPYGRLVAEFFSLTGVPMVLNTSFNLRGEPIVCRPAEAIADFVMTDMDALLLGDRLLSKDTMWPSTTDK